MFQTVYTIRKLFLEKLAKEHYYRMISIRSGKIHHFLCVSEQILGVSLLSDSTCFITQYTIYNVCPTADKEEIFWMDLCG